eukprot:PITA_04792
MIQDKKIRMFLGEKLQILSCQRNIEFNRDVSFDEDVALGKESESYVLASIGRRDDFMDVDAEQSMQEPDLADEPMDPLDPATCARPTRKKPLWLYDTLQNAKRHSTLRGTFRESKQPPRYQGCAAFMSDIIQFEPCNFEGAMKEHVWRDAMVEEYESIMKNDLWEFVSRPEGKSVVTSKCICKIKHVANVSIEKFKSRFLARGFS